ncbi:hypothetical protein EVAR_80997_1 [Eumeta japonica]|uniref:Uncharacterized protein n=1 Tax=Eumeta variegata TaxID=151549 RepID=A0A4C1ZXX9_EUMVA|nr:hypothetical protein EVAR_80997_1 [Eumeta japonica]
MKNAVVYICRGALQLRQIRESEELAVGRAVNMILRNEKSGVVLYTHILSSQLWIQLLDFRENKLVCNQIIKARAKGEIH